MLFYEGPKNFDVIIFLDESQQIDCTIKNFRAPMLVQATLVRLQ